MKNVSEARLPTLVNSCYGGVNCGLFRTGVCVPGNDHGFLELSRQLRSELIVDERVLVERIIMGCCVSTIDRKAVHNAEEPQDFRCRSAWFESSRQVADYRSGSCCV